MNSRRYDPNNGTGGLPPGSARRAGLDRVELPDPGSQAALALALRAAGQAEALCEEVDRKAREAAAASSLAPVAEALRCVRGCGFATAPASTS